MVNILGNTPYFSDLIEVSTKVRHDIGSLHILNACNNATWLYSNQEKVKA